MVILAGETGCREWVAGSIAAVKPRATGPARGAGGIKMPRLEHGLAMLASQAEEL
jgi:hypothetical protein